MQKGEQKGLFTEFFDMAMDDDPESESSPNSAVQYEAEWSDVSVSFDTLIQGSGYATDEVPVVVAEIMALVTDLSEYLRLDFHRLADVERRVMAWTAASKFGEDARAVVEAFVKAQIAEKACQGCDQESSGDQEPVGQGSGGTQRVAETVLESAGALDEMSDMMARQQRTFS